MRSRRLAHAHGDLCGHHTLVGASPDAIGPEVFACHGAHAFPVRLYSGFSKIWYSRLTVLSIASAIATIPWLSSRIQPISPRFDPNCVAATWRILLIIMKARS